MDLSRRAAAAKRHRTGHSRTRNVIDVAGVSQHDGAGTVTSHGLRSAEGSEDAQDVHSIRWRTLG